MEKPGCSLGKLATEEELKVLESESGGKAVKDVKRLTGLPGLVSRAGGPPVSTIFPPEVWKMILKRVRRSEDIYNVLLAFPQLDKAFRSEKTLWLFGAVLPHLMTKHLVIENVKKIDFNDLGQLRCVSKTCKASVDSSLRSHVALRHLPPQSLNDSQKDHQLLMPSENHFSYHRLQNSKFGASIFRTGEQIDEFLKTMTNHPGNPFPGKYVNISMNSSNLEECLTLFEKFGEHVLFLEIEVKGEYRECHFQQCENVLKCLSQSPNLRSLSITGELPALTDQQTGWEIFSKSEADNVFPDLPNLEAFKCQVDLKGMLSELSIWIFGLTQKYARKDGLCRLDIPAHVYALDSSNLTSLTEINLVIQNEESTTIENTLKKLPNPQILRKLSLQHDWMRVNVKKLIALLTEYKVESLNLEDVKLDDQDQHFWYKKETVAPMMEATSITSLYFNEELETSYDFLKGLPNLHFLTIHFTVFPIVKWRYHFEVAYHDSLANRIRGYVLKACDKYANITRNEGFSIWKELPKLQMFSATVTKKSRFRKDSVWNVKFVRECGDKAFFFGNSPARNERVRVLIEDLDEEEDDWVEDDFADFDMDHSFHG